MEKVRADDDVAARLVDGALGAGWHQFQPPQTGLGFQQIVHVFGDDLEPRTRLRKALEKNPFTDIWPYLGAKMRSK